MEAIAGKPLAKESNTEDAAIHSSSRHAQCRKVQSHNKSKHSTIELMQAPCNSHIPRVSVHEAPPRTMRNQSFGPGDKCADARLSCEWLLIGRFVRTSTLVGTLHTSGRNLTSSNVFLGLYWGDPYIPPIPASLGDELGRCEHSADAGSRVVHHGIPFSQRRHASQ